MSSSNSAEDKIKRAISQIENAERLIASLPRRFYQDDQTREVIRELTNELEITADIIRTKLEHKFSTS